MNINLGIINSNPGMIKNLSVIPRTDPNAKPLALSKPEYAKYWIADEGNKYSYEVSISEEGKLMAKRLGESDTAWAQEGILTLPGEDGAKEQINVRRVDGFATFFEEKQMWNYQMTRSLMQNDVERYSGEFGIHPYSFDALENMHAKIGEGLKARYNGEELEGKLKSLDEEYGAVLDYQLESLTSTLTNMVQNPEGYEVSRPGERPATRVIQKVFGRDISYVQDIIADIDPERFQQYSGKLNGFVEFLTDLSERLKSLPEDTKRELEFLDTDIDPATIPDALKEYLSELQRESAEEDSLILSMEQTEEEEPSDTALTMELSNTP